MKRIIRRGVGVFLVSLVAACSPSPTQVVTDMDAAFTNKNLEALSATLADDVTMTMGPQTVSGKEQVKASFQKLIESGARSERVGEYKLEGDTVTWREKEWSADWTKLGLDGLEADMRATVVNGKIAGLSWSLTEESAKKLEVAQAEQVKKVVVAFDAAIAQKNADAAVALLHDGALVTLDKPYTTKEALVAALKTMFEDNLKVEMGERVVAGNTVTWTAKVSCDTWNKANLGALEGKVTAMVEEGKIKSYVNEWTADSQKKLESLTATAAATPAPAPGAKKSKK